MMLDMKRTFDEIVEPHAEPGAGRSRSSTNPFYQSLSSSLLRHAGVHGDGEARPAQHAPTVRQLGPDRRRHPADAAPRWTSSTRRKRLGSFLDGRMIRLLLAPAKAGGRRT